MATLLTEAAVVPGDQRTDFSAFSDTLKSHLRLVRDRGRQQAFRSAVLERQGAFCAVCDIAVAAALDAAHVIPKGSDGSDDARNGLALCVLHHRLFDAGLFAIDPGTLMVRAHPDHTLDDMRITRTGTGHLKKRPHADALAWRWEHLPLP